MNYLQFRTWIVETVNRDDVIATSTQLHRAIASARRFIQQRHNFKGMEEHFEVALTLDQVSVGTPDGFKEPVIVSINDQAIQDFDKVPQIILAREWNRHRFRRLVSLTSPVDLVKIYSDVLVLIDTTGTRLEGFPLIYSVWRGQVDLFPKVGSQADGKLFFMDYYAYRQFDLSTLPPGAQAGQLDGFEDFLLNEFADLTYYRSLTELAPFIRENEQGETWLALYKEKEDELMREDIGKEEAGVGTMYMSEAAS